MLGVYVTVPIACFRKGLAREYLGNRTTPAASYLLWVPSFSRGRNESAQAYRLPGRADAPQPSAAERGASYRVAHQENATRFAW